MKQVNDMIETKKCSDIKGCGLVLPVSEFYWRNKKKRTRRSLCKSCCTKQRQDNRLLSKVTQKNKTYDQLVSMKW